MGYSFPIETLKTNRLLLEVLTPAHAEEMMEVLASPEIYAYIEDCPPELDQLRQRYIRQSKNWSGYPISWNNWIIRSRLTGSACGYIQATINYQTRSAELAWVLSPKYFGKGYASEAARRIIAEIFNSQSVDLLFCTIDSQNLASKELARALGFSLVHLEPQHEQKWKMDMRN